MSEIIEIALADDDNCKKENVLDGRWQISLYLHNWDV